MLAVIVALRSTAIVSDIHIAVKSVKKTCPTEPIRQGLSFEQKTQTKRWIQIIWFVLQENCVLVILEVASGA